MRNLTGLSAAFKAGREKLPKIQGFDLDRIDVKVPAEALGRQISGIGGRASMVEFVASAMWQWEHLIPIADTGQLGRKIREPLRDLAAEGAFAFAKTLKVGEIAARICATNVERQERFQGGDEVDIRRLAILSWAVGEHSVGFKGQPRRQHQVAA